MTGRSSQHVSGMRSSARLSRVAGIDAASLARMDGEVPAAVWRAFAQRDGGVWNTFGIGTRVTGGASPFGTISDAVSDLDSGVRPRAGRAGEWRIVTTTN